VLPPYSFEFLSFSFLLCRRLHRASLPPQSFHYHGPAAALAALAAALAVAAAGAAMALSNGGGGFATGRFLAQNGRRNKARRVSFITTCCCFVLDLFWVCGAICGRRRSDGSV